MPQTFTLVQKSYGPQGPRRNRKPVSQNSYFEHMEFDDLVVQRKDHPSPNVFYYNKPHDQFCFAHITMLSNRWQPHDYEFHVTVYVLDEPPIQNTMELVYQKTEQVRYRAVKNQDQWTCVTLPPQAALTATTPLCAQQYAEAFISYLNHQFRQYYGGRKATRNRRKLSRASRKKRAEARQLSGAKSSVSCDYNAPKDEKLDAAQFCHAATADFYLFHSPRRFHASDTNLLVLICR